MNRIRNLIGHQRSGTTSDQQDSNEQQPVAINNDVDDQSTVFGDQSDEIPDTVTLNTVVSGSLTIGDFQRQGFVNRCPTFNAARTMPLAYVLLTKGFFCFPSEKAYEKFLDNNRTFNTLDTNEGLGIPLFHAISAGVIKTMFNRHAPIMRIYKYMIIDTDTEKPPKDGTLVAQDGSKMLYKYLFCTIYQELMNDYSRVEHKFVFSGETAPENIVLANYVLSRGTDTKMQGLNLRWYGTTGFASPFGASVLKLLVLDDGMPSMMDQCKLEEFEEYSKSYKGRSLGKLPIWATYSDKCSTMIPKKRSLRLAEFNVGETGRECSRGIIDIPIETEALACMCMVLHDFESRKDRRGGGAMVLPAVPFI